MPQNPAASRGVLYPAQLPSFHRIPAAGELSEFVRWFWVTEWNIAPGRSSRQQVIAFPASNLVVESTQVGISGPTTRASHRDLTGQGWGVAALLRPAAVPALIDDVHAMLDSYLAVDQPELLHSIQAAMNADARPLERRQAAVTAFTEWLCTRLGSVTAEGLLANRLVEAAENDRALLKATDLAAELNVSLRTLQRLSAKYVGLSPAALIRRRRLQEAAEQLRARPNVDLTALAYELGYADHAHLTNDFHRALGVTPSAYRRALGDTPRAQRTP